VNAFIIVAVLLSADPQVERSLQLSFAELPYLLSGDGKKTPLAATPELKGYLDRKVRFRGYIMPASMAADKSHRLALVPDNQYMSGSPSDPREFMFVECKQDVSFTTKPITVEGTLRHRKQKDRDGIVIACVAIADAEVVADNQPPGIRSLLKTFREEFIEITPGKGKFPAEATIGEGKTTKVKLTKPFHIAKYEVPQDLWEAVMGENPSKWKGKRNSVEMLDFDDAREFCTKVTRHLRAAKLIGPAQIVRLPSEAEWEYCTRAGTATRFSFGDDVGKIDDFAWHTGNAAGNDPPVGAKAPNPWGLYDAHGYLWEWCSDTWTDDISKLPADGNPYLGPGDEAAKVGVLRSGSWKDKPEDLASGFRRRAERALADDAVGLRCVLADEPTR